MAAAALFAGVALADTTPQYPGGQEALDKYIAENLQYPEAAKANGIEGVVGTAFTVNPDGSIGQKSVRIVRMVDPDLEKEAIRLVLGMPAWIPAEKNGAPVEAPAQVDINFVLP